MPLTPEDQRATNIAYLRAMRPRRAGSGGRPSALAS